MEEIWVDVQGFEGIYQISNLGRFKSTSRYLNGAKGIRKLKERIRNTQKDKDGYSIINLYAGNICKGVLIHRVVALHFVDGSGPQVNHINGLKNDNRACNLEWCTQSENIRHAIKTGLKKPSPNVYKPGILHPRFKGVIEGNPLGGGNSIFIYGAEDAINKGFTPESISRCAGGKQKSHRGYTFSRRNPI